MDCSRVLVKLVLQFRGSYKLCFNDALICQPYRQCHGQVQKITVPFRNSHSQQEHVSNYCNTQLRNNNYYTALAMPRKSIVVGFTAKPIRHYCQTTVGNLDKKLNPTGPEKKKLAGKTAPIEKVFLISDMDDISEVTMVEAEKIAKKRGLQLVKVDDTKGRIKTDKKVYKLMSNAQYFGDDWKSRLKKKDSPDAESSGGKEKDKHKDDKSLVIKSKITQHDLMSKVKNIKKLVEKGHSVRIFIEEVQGSTLEASEAVYSSMEESLKGSARFVQKRNKGAEIRFQVIPPKVDESANKTVETKENAQKSPDKSKSKS